MAEPSKRIPNLARGRQGRLFDPLATEVLGELGIESAEIEAWMQAGLLSYDPRTCEKVNEAEEAELTFVAAVARSGLSYRAMCHALSQLEKPYAYWPSDVVWDFGQGNWRYIQGEIQDALEQLLPKLTEEEFIGYIERLTEDGDLEGLQALMGIVRRAIRQIADAPGGMASGEAV